MLKSPDGPWTEDLIALALADGEPVTAATAAILKLDQGHCRWPIGEPGNSDFRFCHAPRRAGRPYCRRHARQAGNGQHWPSNDNNSG